jgi:hypothetical protein
VAFEVTGKEDNPAGSGAALTAGMWSSGFRRLNKTPYQAEKGTAAYHGVCFGNNILFGLFHYLIDVYPAGPGLAGQRHIKDMNHGGRADDGDQ